MGSRRLSRVGLWATVMASGALAGAASASADVFTVANTNDSGRGSLRSAILQANSQAGADEVHFDIPGRGVHTILVRTAADASTGLPSVTGPLSIDGRTQPGFAGTPLIELENDFENDRQLNDRQLTGLKITAGHSRVASLSMTGFEKAIVLMDNGSNVIAGNRLNGNKIGVRATSPSNTIGGTTPADRNVVANSDVGVFVGDSNLIEGNFIGTDAAGGAQMRNSFGVFVGGVGSTVGGSAPGAGNLISGNGTGILIAQSASGNFVAGNRIGTNLAGTGALPNEYGVLVSGNSNTIGGVTPADRNVISGNDRGITIFRRANNVIGNYIGTTPDGDAALPNKVGVELQIDAKGNMIGGDRETSGNLISGNSEAGISFFLTASTNVVAGNDIGLARARTQPLSNGTGILIAGVPTSPTHAGIRIGGATPALRNVISGNSGAGIAMTDSASGDFVQGNFIGTGRGGQSPMPNGGDGIALSAGANDNTIGGSDPGQGNTIAFNGGAGVGVDGSVVSPTGNVIRGNAILGNSIFDNTQLGIALLAGANDNQPAPAIESVTTIRTQTTITGTLTSARPSTTYRVEVFRSPSCNASGEGEGKQLIATTTTTTDAAGEAGFTATVSSLTAGQAVTATATPVPAPHNTSQFSRCAST
ncbi:NosD domain-containing protein [Capillimicrobium parvum]|uniref:Right handed beta helix domain-containing protein n=1 Tax=Capillimicrobium parvum TaxID=2884022 RepID=A0A9E7BYM1_9ACTN|nr:NosD domain-containing protein [Capillimicrobium parvum]UGS34531.1 hypothetical protein DSM104329_00909 [Capillimicrobium parvum]